jgi:lipase chaperone LimK
MKINTIIAIVLLLSTTLFANERTNSLEGSQVDGGLTLRAGLFFPDRNALDMFDYFMTLNGEMPFAEIEARVISEIESRLDGRNAKSAIAFWQTYLGYLDEIESVERMASKHEETYVWDMAQQLNDLWTLRRSHFGDELATRLFAEDEAIDTLKLARMQVEVSGKRVDPHWREQIRALEEAQPEYAKVATERALLPSRIRAFTQKLRAEGLSEAEVQEQRAQAFGTSVNARLTELEERRAAWNARIEALVASIDSESSKRRLTPEAREDLAQTLIRQQFTSEPEQIRASAILRMRGQL